MKTKILLIMLLVLFSFVFGYQYDQKIEKTFKLTKDGTVKLENVNGKIEISTHPGNEVFVKAVKMAEEKACLEDVKVKFDYRGNENYLKVFTERTKKKSKVKVNFYVRVPEKLNTLKAASVNGEVEVGGLFGTLHSKTVNGGVRVEGRFGNGEFNTVNGGIDVYLKNTLAGDIHAKTVNGGVKIELKGDSSFKVDASTLNGGVKSDFDLSVKSGFVGKKMSGTVKGGKNKIFLKTVNGSIKLLKI